jgi:AcrR family transcriptional regulator
VNKDNRKGAETRARLVTAARRTIHEQGVEQSTLAGIAAAAEVPLGNVYYYFKTKEDLVRAVVENYDHDYDVLHELLEKHQDPRDRLKALIDTWLMAKERIALYGCPIGSLCSELGKRDVAMTSTAAGLVLAKLIDVAEEQFVAMGSDDPHGRAITMIAAYEGAALLSHAMHDPQLLTDHADRLTRWIDSIEVVRATGSS